MTQEKVKVVAENRRAKHDYFIEESFEAGIALKGTEVKSLREGKVSIKDAFILIRDGEAYIHNMHISPYEKRGYADHEPKRERKLLLKKREIMYLWGKVKERGMTVIPLRVYFNQRGKAKIEIALARGKKIYDKRETLKEKEAQREIEKAFRQKQKYDIV